MRNFKQKLSEALKSKLTISLDTPISFSLFIGTSDETINGIYPEIIAFKDLKPVLMSINFGNVFDTRSIPEFENPLDNMENDDYQPLMIMMAITTSPSYKLQPLRKQDEKPIRWLKANGYGLPTPSGLAVRLAAKIGICINNGIIVSDYTYVDFHDIDSAPRTDVDPFPSLVDRMITQEELVDAIVDYFN